NVGHYSRPSGGVRIEVSRQPSRRRSGCLTWTCTGSEKLAARSDRHIGSRCARWLHPNSTHPKDSDAWLGAFVPAQQPNVAVAVMLVGGGLCGTSAAPIASQVLRAALADSQLCLSRDR